MAEIVIVHRTDVHLAAQPPASRTDDYAEAILEKLRIVGNIALKVGAEAVIDSGDFFHSKTPVKTPHWLMRRISEVHRAYPCPTYIVPGNHDLSGARVDSLDRQPLGVLLAAGVFRMLDDVTLGGGDRPLIRLVGIPYSASPTIGDYAIAKGKEDALVAVTHANMSKTGGLDWVGDAGEPVFSWTDLAKLPPDVWLGGHWHKDQGCLSIDGKYFAFPGSLSRGSLTDDELGRVPNVAVIRFRKDDGRLSITSQIVPMTRTPAAEKVFDLGKKADHAAMQKRIAALVDSLTKAKIGTAGTPEDVLNELKDVSETVRRRVRQYLENAYDR